MLSQPPTTNGTMEIQKQLYYDQKRDISKYSYKSMTIYVKYILYVNIEFRFNEFEYSTK